MGQPNPYGANPQATRPTAKTTRQTAEAIAAPLKWSVDPSCRVVQVSNPPDTLLEFNPMEYLMEARPGWIAVLAEVEGLRWVLENHQMAFTKGTASRSRRIEVGDLMILYVGRGAYHNPIRDESQLLGLTEVTSRVRNFPEPIEIAGRDFVCSCHLRFDELLPERAGVPVKPLVASLSFVRRPDVWGQYFRSGLVEVPAQDLQRLADAVRAAVRLG